MPGPYDSAIDITTPDSGAYYQSKAAAETAKLAAAWWAVAARFLLHGLIVSTWVSRIPAVKAALGLTNGMLGFCLLGTAVGSVAAVPVTGWLVTRFGSKSVTTWSTAGFCLALATPALAVNSATLFLALAIYGAMAGANDVSINSQAIAVETALETPTISRFHAMFSFGGMLGAGLGGVVAAHKVLPQAHLMLASALFLAISAGTAHHLLDAPDGASHQTARLSLARIPTVLIILTIIGFCMFLSEGAMADWIAVYMKQVLEAGSGLAAAGYAMFSAGMAIFRLLGDAITRRLGPVQTVRAGALVAACGLTAALATHSTTWALTGFALTGAGFSVIVPLVFAAGGRVPSLPRGVGIAMVSGSGYIGFLFGPPLIGFVAQLTSLRAGLSIVVGLCIVAAMLASSLRAAAE
jgi:MFS family permease